jgi:ribonuclease-3
MLLPLFKDASLLQRALTHRSYLNEHTEITEDNERLEFLGDAVLDFVVGAMLYNRLPEMKEGRLTRLRSSLVRNEQLAAFATQLGVGDLLRLGKGEEDNGGRQRASLLCATFEAIIGAYYLDAGIDASRDYVEQLFQPALDQILAEQADADAKSHLQEWAQAERKKTPHYKVIGREGPDHDQQFTVEVYVGEERVGVGTGRNKRAAQQAAAVEALKKLGLA